jgi:hypothetical protein
MLAPRSSPLSPRQNCRLSAKELLVFRSRIWRARLGSNLRNEKPKKTRRERQTHGIAKAKADGVYIGRQPGTVKTKPAPAQQLRGKGLTVLEIAKAMGVSERTVFNYLAG